MALLKEKKINKDLVLNHPDFIYPDGFLKVERIIMTFKTLFLAHAPDGDYEKHNSIIDTGKYKLFSFIVKSQPEAIKISKSIYEKENINAIILCPGFTHKDVSEIFQALDGKVSVNVARGDGPSSKIAQPIIQKVYYNK